MCTTPRRRCRRLLLRPPLFAAVLSFLKPAGLQQVESPHPQQLQGLATATAATSATSSSKSSSITAMSFRKSVTAAQLEQVAAKVTLYGRSVRAQLRTTRGELEDATRAIATSEDDLDESEARLEEIEELMASHEEEIEHLRAQPEPARDVESLQARAEELDELLDERDEELQLLEHIRSVLRMQQLARASLQQRVAALSRELAQVRKNEQALVLVALRSRFVKILPPKV